MKRFGLIAILFAGCLSGAVAAPAGIKTVYILPMSGGFDQYLAEWLTRTSALQVVTDAKAADAVMTDSLGEAFEQKLAQIRPDTDKKDARASDAAPVHAYTSGRSKGTLFLVDAKTRSVIWSDYEKAPRTSSSANLNRQAERVAKKLAGTPSK
jgi:hypothetical protein